MTQRIFKYPLELTDSQQIEMPAGARILAVQTQQSQLCLWALVDDDVPPEPREIHMRGTGHDCTGVDRLRYIGTFQMMAGTLVFHVFESPRQAHG